MRVDAEGWAGFAAANLRAGAGTRLGAEGTDTQPAFAGGYLRAGDEARRGRRGGELMRAYLTLTRRELAGYFLSLSGYVVMALTLFLVGLSFVALLQALQREPTAMPVTELFHVTWYFLFILMLPTPVITMRLFALEKFSGTFETLMTTPVRDVEVVLAKFSAAFLFYLVMWLPHLGSLWVVCHYTNSPAALEAGAIGT